jgi:hypothetical protein
VDRVDGHALERRDAAIVRRYEAGETLAAIGVSLGLTRDRIRQIVKASGAVMPRDYKCAVRDCSTAPPWPHVYCQHHLSRFEKYGDPLGNRPVDPLLGKRHGTLNCYHYWGCRCALCRGANADRVREHRHLLRPEMRRYKPRDRPIAT